MDSSNKKPLSGHVDSFLELVGQVSISTLLPMLDARQRWFVFMEVLLGHAQVRGGRPRDYPFSRQRRLSTQIGAELTSCTFAFRPGQSREAVKIAWYDVLVATQFVELAGLSEPESGPESERHYTAALLTLIDLLFASEDQDRIAEQFGISDQGLERSAPAMRAFNREVLRLAQVMAAVARAPRQEDGAYPSREQAIERFQLRPGHVRQLDGLRVDLLILKVKSAQKFLDACRKPFIQRGASAWCSQVASRCRDLLTETGECPVCPVIDCDAVTLLAMPAVGGLQDIESKVSGHFLSDRDDTQLNPDFIARYHPRLRTYYDQAVAEAQHTARALPFLGYEFRREQSLFHLTLRYARSLTHSDANNGKTLRFSVTPNHEPSAPCAGHQLSDCYTDPDYRVPLWYNPSGDQAYGFVSTAFSLAEVTYTRMTGIAIREHLTRATGQPIRLLRTQREMVRYVSGRDDAPIMLLKYDGDRIGEQFSGESLLCRAALSLQLERTIRDAWIQAVATVITNNGYNASPVDLLYLGGDDLMMALPAELAADFIDAFDATLADAQTTDCRFSFSFAGISRPVRIAEKPENKAGGGEDAQLAVIQRVNAALDAFKAQARGQSVGSADSQGDHSVTIHGCCASGILLDTI